MKTKILIEVSGSVVQGVYCNNPDAEVTLIDWDNIGQQTELVDVNNYPVEDLTPDVMKKILIDANKQVLDNREVLENGI